MLPPPGESKCGVSSVDEEIGVEVPAVVGQGPEGRARAEGLPQVVRRVAGEAEEGQGHDLRHHARLCPGRPIAVDRQRRRPGG